MADYSISKSDSVTITERIDVLVGGTRRITVSENVLITERIDILRAGARNITVNDSPTLRENIDIIRAGARNINTSDMTFPTEGVQLSILDNPALINRTIPLIVKMPTSLNFIVTKKNV